jgi:hypothetical protein
MLVAKGVMFNIIEPVLPWTIEEDCEEKEQGIRRLCDCL